MTNALLTKEDIRKFIFDAILQYGENKILNRKDFCNYFNISFYELNQFLDKGLPWIGSPTRKRFNVNECRKWFNANK